MSIEREPLSAALAEELLDGLPLVPAMAGSIDEMKRVRAQCLAAGIPALVGCPGGAGRSCGPKTHLLVEEDDVPAVAEVLRASWDDSLAREGLAAPVVASVADGAEPPCPACGSTAGLGGDGCCADCGLQLG